MKTIKFTFVFLWLCFFIIANVNAQSTQRLLLHNWKGAYVFATDGADGTLPAAFDGLTTSGDKYGSNYLPVFVTVQLPVPQALTQYSFTTVSWTSDRSPRTWKVMAGDDGANWVKLDEVVGYTGFTTSYQTQTFTFTNTTAYSYYRFEITEVKNSTIFGVSEINFPQFTGLGNVPSFVYNSFITTPTSGQRIFDRPQLSVLNTSAEINVAVYTNTTSAPISAAGAVYSTTSAPTLESGTVVSGTRTNEFLTVSITGLTAGQTYYVRPYATNANGTAYGNEYVFTTPTSEGTIFSTTAPAPSPANANALRISSIGADLTTNVLSNGGSALTERGVVWSTDINPDYNSAGKYSEMTASTGSFTGKIANLTSGTLYYARPYIVNGNGVIYGAQYAFYAAKIENHYWKPGLLVESDFSHESYRWGNQLRRAFDNGNNVWIYEGDNAYLQFSFVTPQIVSGYSMQQNNDGTWSFDRAPKAWIFEAFNEVTQSWIELDNRSNIITWTGTTFNDYTFSNTTPYKRYRIRFTQTQSGNKIYRIAEFKLNNAYVGVSESALTGFSSSSGGAVSQEKMFRLSGNDLSAGNLTITAPTGFEVSTTSGSGFTNSISITPATGSISTRSIYVRVAANQPAGSISGDISLSHASIATINIPCSATVSRTQVEITSSQDLTGLDNSTADLVISGASTVLTVNATKSYNKITINDQATLDLSNQGALTVNELIVKAGKNSAAIVKATRAMTVSDKFELHKTIDNTKSYFVSFPTDVNIDDIYKLSGTETLVYGTNWRIKYYDGASRVDNLGAQSNWKNMNAGEVLEANKGYIIQLATGLIGDYELAFPLNRNYLSNAETNKSLSVVAHGEGSVAANHVGWNLIGVPFLSKFAGGSFPANYITFRNAAGTAYTQLHKNDVSSINPYEAVFMQANVNGANATGLTLNFETSGRQLAKATVQNTQSVAIKLANVQGEDFTTVLLDDSFDSNYVINQDLEKWLTINGPTPQIYTQLDNIKYAYNSLNFAGAKNIALDIYTQASIENTISLQSSNLNDYNMLLTDLAQNTTVNLGLEAYTFNSQAGVNDNRFVLSVEPKSSIPTSLYDNVRATNIRAYGHNKNIFVVGAKGAIITVSDVSGKVLLQQKVESDSLTISDLDKGAYVVKINYLGKVFNNKIIL